MKPIVIILVMLVSIINSHRSEASIAADVEMSQTLKEAEGGDVVAQYNLGIFYANGRGVTKNNMEAVKWYRKSAEAGFA
jgi:TPR repeat protein